MTAIRSDSGFIIESDIQPILDVDEEASIASDESIGMFVQKLAFDGLKGRNRISNYVRN